MTKYEHYEEKIERITRVGLTFGFDPKKNEVFLCEGANCGRCLFISGNCEENKLKWADEEYKEPEVDWSKVPIDTPVLAAMDKAKWYNFYFAGTDDYGNTYVYSSGRTSWSSKTAYDSDTVKVPYIRLAEVE